MASLFRTAAGWLERSPDTPAMFERRLREPWKQFALLLLAGLILRIATFGDPNLHVDEAFYFVVGQEMHHGALPYVDIWDRKPVGLFLIYYLIAGISANVVAYQVAAWLFASATAWIIARIAARWAGVQGSVLAGVTYLLMLGPFEGFGGQTPIFYNLLIAGAALLLLRAQPQLAVGVPTGRTFMAMALCGLALTIKQTTLFESLCFGLFVSWNLWRSPAPMLRIVLLLAVCAVLGALPTLLSALAYYQLGHWAEFWQAMVTSNLAKVQPTILLIALNCLRIVLRLYPYFAMIWLGIRFADPAVLDRRDKVFMTLWLVGAVLGVTAVPNFYSHYALPLLVPLAAVSALALDRRDIGLFAAAMVATFSMVLIQPFDRAGRLRSIESMDRMAQSIRLHDSGGGLLVYDGPPYLYALADKRPLTPLAFPHHLNDGIEKDVSQFNTLAETKRILKAKPGVLAISVFPSNIPENAETRSLVLGYAVNNCQLVDVDLSLEINHSELIAIYGDCRSTGAYLHDY